MAHMGRIPAEVVVVAVIVAVVVVLVAVETISVDKDMRPVTTVEK